MNNIMSIFYIRTIMLISMMVFWVVMPCDLVGVYQRFRGTYNHIQGEVKDGGNMF
jgi:hypothetical protein